MKCIFIFFIFQIEILEQSSNVTIGYYVTQDRLVFIPAVVIEMLIAYGVTNATLDIRKHVPNLHSVAVLALPWNPLPAYHFQLKTGKFSLMYSLRGNRVISVSTATNFSVRTGNKKVFVHLRFF